MKLVISIDVEEEGLFSGRYARTPPGVTNVAALERLAFIPRDFGLPLTLLVTYQVARDPAACRVLSPVAGPLRGGNRRPPAPLEHPAFCRPARPRTGGLGKAAPGAPPG